MTLACSARVTGIKRWVYSKIGRAALPALLFFSAFHLSVLPLHAKTKPRSRPEKISLNYQGPLRIFIFDVDGVVMGFNSGETFPVFLWPESTSPFHDIASSDLPQVIEVPKNDWENGVRSEIPQYDRMPVKDLVGEFHNLNRGIRDPGNSYYDKPIRLSNGQTLNPRLYYKDVFRTHKAFRTNRSENHLPLVDAAKTMLKNKDFGPAFDLLALTSQKKLPVQTMLLTYRGHEEYEWAQFKNQMIKAGYFESDAEIERIFALNNPRLQINDPTSATQFGRADMPLPKKKVLILEYVIDHILPRRMDRENPDHPRPNVLVYAEDNPQIAEMVRDLFLRKAHAVQDRNNKLGIYQPPIRLILWNLAPAWYYEEMPNALRETPRALANKPIDLDEIMVFDSHARYQAGESLISRPKTKDPLAKIVSLAFDVSESAARRVLNDRTNCAALLANSQRGSK